MQIILASNSPRRRELLSSMGVGRYEAVSPGVDEHKEGEPAPEQLVTALSARKAAAAADKAAPDNLVIAADTVVVLDGEVLGKPRDKADACRMLLRLSGRKHRVYTGLTVRQGDRVVTEVEMTEVSFRELNSTEISRYVSTGEPMDKAGAYGIQGYGALLVEGICGDYFNVMGLPVNRLRGILLRFGVDCMELVAAKLNEEKAF
jgi:septum formation protein